MALYLVGSDRTTHKTRRVPLFAGSPVHMAEIFANCDEMSLHIHTSGREPIHAEYDVEDVLEMLQTIIAAQNKTT